MGESANDMIEGRACQICGEWLEEFVTDGYSFGYPVSCPRCKAESRR